MTRYKLDGSDFPKDPLSKRWSRQQVATGGAGEPIYTAFWQIELAFPVLSVSDEVSFFEGRWLAGGLHTAVLPHPKTGSMTGFTGVAIADFSYELSDVDSDGWTESGPRLRLQHINLGATGTV